MSTLQAVRRFLLVILLVGMAGTLIELLLMGHDEDATQFIPLVLLGLGLVTTAWHARASGPLSARAARTVMLAFVAAGVAGLYFHYRANVEFQLETDPTLRGRALLRQVLQAKVPPALAPAIMIQFGLLGLAYTYRYEER